MKYSILMVSIIAVAATMTPGPSHAQDDEQVALYLSIDCMKSTASDYVSVGKRCIRSWLIRVSKTAGRFTRFFTGIDRGVISTL